MTLLNFNNHNNPQMFMEKGATPIDRELNKKVVKIIHGLLMM